jgi:hypothetical protein
MSVRAFEIASIGDWELGNTETWELGNMETGSGWCICFSNNKRGGDEYTGRPGFR